MCRGKREEGEVRREMVILDKDECKIRDGDVG